MVSIGVNLPHYGPDASPDGVRRFAVTAEELGFASLWVVERTLRPLGAVVLPSGLGAQMPPVYANVLSPLETLVHVAGCTTTIRLGTSVLDVLFHTPATLGRRLATVDHFCQGRLTVGIGQGYVPEEFASANVPLSRRGRGFDDFVGGLRAVWGPDPVSYQGTFYSVPTSEIGPKPVQSDGPPLLMGVNSVAGAQRAGRLGLGLNVVTSTWDDLGAQIDAFKEAAVGVGNDPASLPVALRAALQDPDGPLALGPEAPFSGPVEELADDVARLATMDVTEVFFDMTTSGWPFDRQIDALPVLADLQVSGLTGGPRPSQATLNRK